MLSSYSPQRESINMMQVPSPTHHGTPYDPHSAIREIRRSLSRSPSKPYSFRSASSNGVTPYSPSPLSPSRRSTSDNVLQLNAFTSQHTGRFVQSSRIVRPGIRRTAQTQSAMRIRTSPKSPSRRVLGEVSEVGNVTPTLRKRSSTELDEDFDMTGDDKENSLGCHEQQMSTWKVPQSRQEKRRSGGLMGEVIPLSPMKRPDAPMNLDQPGLESPSAKRRSVHAASALDFSSIDSDALKETLGERRSQDDNDWFRMSTPFAGNRFSTIPKRSSSLRKSTLQQRPLERPAQPKFGGFADLGIHWSDAMPAASEEHPPARTPGDTQLPLLQRDSPFSNPGGVLDTSVRPAPDPNHDGTTRSNPFGCLSSRTLTQPPTQLSTQPSTQSSTHTSTQTSSLPSEQDDSPTHEPVRRPDRPRSHDFSKSLPVGASLPMDEFVAPGETSHGSFATPAHYKWAKPLPAAFMSTGLISKKNRNVNEPDAGLPKAHMPDTPCKKQSVIFDTKPKVRTSKGAVQTLQETFGTPATPYENAFACVRASPLPWAKSIFVARSKHSLARKASFASIASIEGDEKPVSHSPSAPGESQSTDTDYPPTPTKHIDPVGARMNSVSPSPQQMQSRSSHPPARMQTPRFPSMGLSNFNDLDHPSPHTPYEGICPPDPSGLSISGKAEQPAGSRPGSSHFVPATPTGPREYFGNFSNRASLNTSTTEATDVDSSLTARFEKVDQVGTGEFSQVYRVSRTPELSPFQKALALSTRSPSRASPRQSVWAVKKSRYPYSGPKDRARKIHEVDVLKALVHNDNVLSFVDSWEDRGHLYIQTEFCEEGTLDTFLADVGKFGRLDDFRIWKILLELSTGLHHVHDAGYIHLDLKPANVLITFEGVLKIADFGMATRWPARAGIDGEGDREYIGPEVLRGQYDKPADIFALGLIVLETAGNVALPDNGLSWQKLRNGDMSDVPSLTWSSADSGMLHDSSAHSVPEDDTESVQVGEMTCDEDQADHPKATDVVRRGELASPPAFMVDPGDEQALDRIVRWMISPDPSDRPVIGDVLGIQGVRWAAVRRRAGATVFEGNWGPADEILAEDAEMTGV